MGQLRTSIHRHLPAAWALIALALALKLLVPVGFMPQVANGGVQLIVCDGMEHSAAAMPAMPGMAHHHHDPAKPDAPCPYAALTAPSLGGADPIQIAALVAAIVAAALFVAVPQPTRTAAYLRPPLRGPPART